MATLEEITTKSRKYSGNDKENECIREVLVYLGSVLKIKRDAQMTDSDKKHNNNVSIQPNDAGYS